MELEGSVTFATPMSFAKCSRRAVTRRAASFLAAAAPRSRKNCEQRRSALPFSASKCDSGTPHSASSGYALELDPVILLLVACLTEAMTPPPFDRVAPQLRTSMLVRKSPKPGFRNRNRGFDYARMKPGFRLWLKPGFRIRRPEIGVSMTECAETGVSIIS